MFPCTQCGQCCKHGNVPEGFDRGDGGCKYYVEKSKACAIYHSRPMKCRIDAWGPNDEKERLAYYQQSAQICNHLQELAGLDDTYRVIIRG